MENVQGILFDADGTLIDTYDLILSSMRHTINDVAGMDASDAELMAGVGTPLRDQMAHFAQGDETRTDELLAIYRDHNHAIHDENVRAFPDTKGALDRLRNLGLKMGVVTSKRHWLAERGLRVAGLADYFEVLIAPEDWPEHKPHPGPVLHGCDVLGLAPEACIYVGDSPYDIQAGNGAGCPTVAALWGMFPESTLAAEHPTYCCEKLSDLAALLEKARPQASR